MNDKKLILYKSDNDLYKVKYYSNEIMLVLSIFLEDGLDLDRYISYLCDITREAFFGNISRMQKNGQNVLIYINEDIFSNMPCCEISIINLIYTLQEFVRLVQLKVDTIEIIIENQQAIVNASKRLAMDGYNHEYN